MMNPMDTESTVELPIVDAIALAEPESTELALSPPPRIGLQIKKHEAVRRANGLQLNLELRSNSGWINSPNFVDDVATLITECEEFKRVESLSKILQDKQSEMDVEEIRLAQLLSEIEDEKALLGFPQSSNRLSELIEIVPRQKIDIALLREEQTLIQEAITSARVNLIQTSKTIASQHYLKVRENYANEVEEAREELLRIAGPVFLKLANAEIARRSSREVDAVAIVEMLLPGSGV